MLLCVYRKYELWIGVAVTEHVIVLIKSLMAKIAHEEPKNVAGARRDQALAEHDLKLEKEKARRRKQLRDLDPDLNLTEEEDEDGIHVRKFTSAIRTHPLCGSKM